MQRSALEHVIRASGAIADDDQIVVIGSQSILGEYPDAPARPKDFEYIGDLVRHEMINRKTMVQRLSETDLSKVDRSRIKSRIESSFKNH